jgi:hypothetical protein
MFFEMAVTENAPKQPKEQLKYFEQIVYKRSTSHPSLSVVSSHIHYHFHNLV